ncbi:hypothetical protein [Ideonella sp. YS5]|uniref:hypothetical protein n=1 Tax=Ideonella sp. YS5 TaxID=3453714 RepID=UPI003EE90571
MACSSSRCPSAATRPATRSPFSEFAGPGCRGVAIRITAPATFDATLLGAALLQALDRQNPNHFHAERTLGMVGSPDTLQRLREGLSPGEARARWEAAWRDFTRRRQAVLLYDATAPAQAAASSDPAR